MVERSVVVRARAFALAYLNASLASLGGAAKPELDRTVSVELHERGVLCVGCDGTALLRAWAPAIPDGPDETPAGFPIPAEPAELAVIVRDEAKFVRTFLGAVLAATSGTDGDEFAPLTVSVYPIDSADEPALGDAMKPARLTLSALGQEMHCPLFEGVYPDWRALHFGILDTERVDGLQIAGRMFAMVGKLREAPNVSVEFHGTERMIEIYAHGGACDVRGFLMPMRRPDPPKAKPAREDESPDLDGFEGAGTVTITTAAGGAKSFSAKVVREAAKKLDEAAAMMAHARTVEG